LIISGSIVLIFAWTLIWPNLNEFHEFNQ
jgi:hypothetical protein